MNFSAASRYFFYFWYYFYTGLFVVRFQE